MLIKNSMINVTFKNFNKMKLFKFFAMTSTMFYVSIDQIVQSAVTQFFSSIDFSNLNLVKSLQM